MPGPGEGTRAAQKFAVFGEFERMNTQALRQGLPDKQLSWLENLQPISANRLLTVPAPAAALLSLPENVTVAFYAAFGGIDYIIAFGVSGAAYAVNISAASFSTFAAAGTFSSAPDVTVWQAQRILINDNTAGYCTYDGTIFVRQGMVSPVITITNGGSGYGSVAPTVTISGGTGVGATATCTTSGGTIASVTLTNPGIGYVATDTLTVAFGTSPGSGATAHVTMTWSIVSIAFDTGGFAIAGKTPGTYALSFSGGGGSGAAGTVTIIAGGAGQLQIQSISITNQGSGFTSAPTITCPSVPNANPHITGSTLGNGVVATIVKDTSGSSYASPPAVTFSGGSPTTVATAHTTLSGNAVNTVVLDTGGAGYQTTPTVIIGTGTGATATAHVWPFITAGTTLAVFQGRVWLGGGTLLQWTGTGGYDDFASADASASSNITDADLIHNITALRTANNYLFIFGDTSVKLIGNISLNAAGNTTLFTIVTLSSDTGTIWPRSIQAFNRIVLFANPHGVYAILGASVQKISDDLDGIFQNTSFATITPQMQLVDINNIRYAVLLLSYTDPVSGARALLPAFDGKKWFLVSQGDGLITIATSASFTTGLTTLYGSSGADITALLQNTAGTVKFKMQTSLSHQGNPLQRKKAIRAGVAALASGTQSATLSVDSENGSETYTLNWSASGLVLVARTADASGHYLGLTLTGTLANFAVALAGIEYQDTNLWH